MNVEDLRSELHHRPFRPFRIHTSDGRSYDVAHPELCMPGRRSVQIGISIQGDELYDRYVTVDLLHITALEPLPTPTPSGNGQASS